MRSPTKLSLYIVLLIIMPSTSFSQDIKFQVIVPSIGFYSARQTELVDWINRNNGQADPLKYGGQLFNISVITESGVIAGFGIGGIYSGISNSSVNLASGGFNIGFQLFENSWIRLNALANLNFYDYTIIGITPNNMPPPPPNVSQSYLRATAWGGGPELQLRIKLIEADDFSISIGTDTGVAFIGPDVNWKFEYSAYRSNGRTYTYAKYPFKGPSVDARLSYLRFSLVFSPKYYRRN
jgi:hypothetical protein